MSKRRSPTNKKTELAATVQLGTVRRELVLIKGDQRYIYRFAPGQEVLVLEELLKLARDPASGVDWYDAALLSHQLGREFQQQFEETQKSMEDQRHSAHDPSI